VPCCLLLLRGGMSGRAIRRARQVRILRPDIVLFGDSITQQSFMPGGWGSRVADAYQRCADIKLRGYSGYNTRWALRTLDAVFPKGMSRSPALVTILLGANDANLAPPLRLQDASASRQFVPLDEFRQNLHTIIQAAQCAGEGGAAVLLISPPPCDTKAWGDHCARQYDIAKEAEPNRNFENTKAYAEAVVQLGKTTSTPTLDLHAAFMRRDDWRTLLSDGLHPNAKGGEFIAACVLHSIERHYPHLRPGGFLDDDPQKIPMDFPDHNGIDADDIDASFRAHATRVGP